MSAAVVPFPEPAPARPAPAGAAIFFRTLMGELRTQPAAVAAAKPRSVNDNDGRRQTA